jgi:hypothetical protein
MFGSKGLAAHVSIVPTLAAGCFVYSLVMNKVLWTVQGLVALIFLFAGGAKLVMPVAQMAQQTGLPGPFLQFVGVCEVLGAIGLILPGLLRIKPGLTPLAACGLVGVMIGATTVSLKGGMVGPALFSGVVGLVAVFIAYGRWRLAPLMSRA